MPLQLPTLSAPPVRKNHGYVGRGIPFPSEQHAYSQVQNEACTRVGHRKSQAYNITDEEAEASGEVGASKILVHSILVLSFFDSGASHCFILILYPVYVWMINEKSIWGMGSYY